MINAPHHIIYLAIIAILIITIVYFIARNVKVKKILHETKSKYNTEIFLHCSIPRGEPLYEAPYSGSSVHPRSYANWKSEIKYLLKRASVLGDLGVPDSNTRQNLNNHIASGRDFENTENKFALIGPIIVLEIVRRLNQLRNTNSELRNTNNEDSLNYSVEAVNIAVGIEYLSEAMNPKTDIMQIRNLTAAAFQNICRQVDTIHTYCPNFINIDRIGTYLCNEFSYLLRTWHSAPRDPKPKETEIVAANTFYRKMKTFYGAVFVIAWLVGGGEPKAIDDIREAGHNFGIALQITTDLNNNNDKMSFPKKYGTETSYKEIDRRLSSCRLNLERLGIYTDVWKEIYNLIQDKSDNI